MERAAVAEVAARELTQMVEALRAWHEAYHFDTTVRMVWKS